MRAEDINSLESESGVIATLIQHPDFIFYSEQLLPLHFTNNENKCMYMAIRNLVRDKGIFTIDPYNIVSYLNSSEKTKEFAGILTVDKLNELKCGKCGYALSLRSYERKKTADARYYVCARKYVAMDCEGIGAVQADKIEDIVFVEIQDKLKEFSSLQMHEKPESTVQMTKLKVRITQIEKEIDTLVEKILNANKTTMNYINKKIEELDEEKNGLKKELADMAVDMYGKKDVGTINNYLDKWETLDISDKITVVDALIDSVRVTENNIDIIWKI